MSTWRWIEVGGIQAGGACQDLTRNSGAPGCGAGVPGSVSGPAGLRRAGWLTVLGLAGLTVGAWAQYPVRQDGRLSEANPQVGSGGYNAARPVSPLARGNLITQGVAGRGLSFQGVSPIGDPTAFRGSLGSAALSSFRRDSVSVADAAGPYGGLLGMPYYDPSRTVYNVGFLSGQTGGAPLRPGPMPAGSAGRSWSPQVTGPLDMRLEAETGTGLQAATNALARNRAALRSQIVGMTPGEGPELSSALFGPTLSRPTVPRRPGITEPIQTGVTRPEVRDYRNLAGLGSYDGPRLDEPPGSRPPLGTPLEYLQRGERVRLPIEEYRDPFAPPAKETTPLVPGVPQLMPERRDAVAGRPPAPPADAAAVPRLRDLSVLPGYDLFTDMQLALALRTDPGAQWFADMQKAIREVPGAGELLREVATVQSQEFVTRLTETPIRTFHGEGPSTVNNELLKAESLLEIGQYYEAVRRYDVAHRLDPFNPLPLIGKGNAYLAAGEYLSAAVALVQGFERYPELSTFRFDLTALMGGGEIVDIRRADIMRRLAGREDARLRFLLGYLEYYSGERESGLRNLEKAAELDQGQSMISRFPAMLRGEGRLPPPKLPPPVPPSPEILPQPVPFEMPPVPGVEAQRKGPR